ncbi:MAG TPA: response regulator [Longimicrobiales bacterium]|nr:response regulator [Longimicrobiales bacterium]
MTAGRQNVAARASMRADRTAESSRPVPGPDARVSSILVVDDEPLARQMFSDLLEAQGFRVVTVARGEEAFGFLKEVDLILLDAMLPGRDGWAICREIKDRHDAMMPIIMVTARTAPDDVVRTFAAGADDYVAKPFHVAELTARIESRLRVHRAEVALKRANQQLRDLADQNYELYERARADAEERALLLKELDHRVRNNLSVIMGLLSMERNRRPPRPSDEALSSLEHRLRSFLLVHDALRRQNYRGVPAREIVEKLSQRLRSAWDPDRRVDVTLEGDVGSLDERRGFALALALNELITNAFRHGFPDHHEIAGNRHGSLVIRLEKTGDRARLQVADNGIGSASARQPDKVIGSGRSIVNALVKDELDGTVDFDSTESGTTVTIEFPLT